MQETEAEVGVQIPYESEKLNMRRMPINQGKRRAIQFKHNQKCN